MGEFQIQDGSSKGIGELGTAEDQVHDIKARVVSSVLTAISCVLPVLDIALRLIRGPDP